MAVNNVTFSALRRIIYYKCLLFLYLKALFFIIYEIYLLHVNFAAVGSNSTIFIIYWCLLSWKYKETIT